MFGLGYQEFLLLIVATAILLVFAPAVFYLLVWVCLRVLKSPLRVLVALWILDTMVALLGELENLNIIFVVGVVLLSPLTIAMQFIVLWVAGSIWRLVGLSTIGDKWRNMAMLHFRSLRPATSC